MRTAAVLLTTILAATPIQAHDLRLEPNGSGYELLYGHRHASHASQDTLDDRPDTGLRLACLHTATLRFALGSQP